MIIRTEYKSIFYGTAAAVAFWLSGAIWQQVFADEAALYDKAPKDAVFVRLLNTQKRALHLSLGGKPLKASGFCRGSDYIYLKAGAYQLASDQPQQQSLDWKGSLEMGRVYSLVASDNGVSLLSEPRFDDPRRAQLSVYNLTDAGALDIQTNPGARPVFVSIDAGTRQSRSVNPIKVSLNVLHHGEPKSRAAVKLADAGMTILQAGAPSSLSVY